MFVLHKKYRCLSQQKARSIWDQKIPDTRSILKCPETHWLSGVAKSVSYLPKL